LTTNCEQRNLDYEAKIAELQVRDSLTGLYNRKHFIRITSAEVKKEREGLVSALLYIRPDRFSAVDERFGPVGSDSVLRSMGLLIEDQAGKRSVVARFGGIIFTVLVVRRSFSEICKLAEDLVSEISTTVFSAGPLSTGITASVGLVELSESITDSTQAFSLAQAAAKQAREKGGNQLQINQSLEVDEDGKLQDVGWVRKIRSALEDGDFHLVYQPIASLMGTDNNSYDVLVRMLDQQRDEILPGEFMPAAERTGLMPALDRWIIEKAFSMSRQREAEGKPSLLFLRVSETSLRDEGFAGWLREAQKLHHVAANSIVLQVSESVAEGNLAEVCALATVCKQLGFQLAVANVGSGANSLQLINLVPMQYVVIDGCFMEDLEDPAQRLQLDQIVAAAREKQVLTIASRVENALALSALYRMGIDYVVGYHVQEPEETIMDNVHLPR
jgi:diguanylate cyclase (GGDEF)-like protein